MRINNNIPALNTHRLLNINTEGLQKSLEKLSSGKRINRASDDAAGLAISQKMEAQVRGLRQASRNSLDGVSLIQVAEGALNEVHTMVQRMRELSVQGANGVYSETDLEAIANEIDQLTQQVDKIASDTEFNGIPLLKGNLNPDSAGIPLEDLKLQVGANENQFIEVDMTKIDVKASTLNIDGLIPLVGSKNVDYEAAITIFNKVLEDVSSMRSILGATQNRLEHTIKNIDNTAENITASKSRIEDLDMALEMSNFTKLNILQQASTSMLGQANQLPQNVLQLLQR